VNETIEVNAQCIIVEHTVSAILLNVLVALEQGCDVIWDTHAGIEYIWL
jgi:hypothetical protein